MKRQKMSTGPSRDAGRAMESERLAECGRRPDAVGAHRSGQREAGGLEAEGGMLTCPFHCILEVPVLKGLALLLCSKLLGMACGQKYHIAGALGGSVG